MEAAGNVLSCQKTEMICKCLLAGNLSKSINNSDNSFVSSNIRYFQTYIFILITVYLNLTAIQNQDKDGNLANTPQTEGRKTQKRSYSRCVIGKYKECFIDCMVFVLKDRVFDHA